MTTHMRFVLYEWLFIAWLLIHNDKPLFVKTLNEEDTIALKSGYLTNVHPIHSVFRETNRYIPSKICAYSAHISYSFWLFQ